MDKQPSDIFLECQNSLLLERKNIVLPKGTVLVLHGCPVTLMTDTVVSADPRGISFAFNRVEANNSIGLAKVDITGQLEFIKSLNSGISF